MFQGSRRETYRGKNIPGTGTSVEGRELGGAGLVCVDPAIRDILLGVGTPDVGGAAHGPRGPTHELALVNLGAIGPNIVLDTDLDVSWNTWVQAKG